MSVNLSLGFVVAPDLGSRVRRALDHRDADPGRLVLELTEAVMLQLPRRARRDLETLDDAGVRVFVDDFGSGYGAVAIFDDLPVRGRQARPQPAQRRRQRRAQRPVARRVCATSSTGWA